MTVEEIAARLGGSIIEVVPVIRLLDVTHTPGLSDLSPSYTTTSWECVSEAVMLELVESQERAWGRVAWKFTRNDDGTFGCSIVVCSQPHRLEPEWAYIASL